MGSQPDVAEKTVNFRNALAELSVAASRNIERWELIRCRSDEICAALDRGEDLPEIVQREGRPRIVETLTSNQATLEEVGSAVRRAEAQALRAHGLTMSHIAELFGVSRQRISELLKGDE